MNDTTTSDDEALDPAGMLALARNQQRSFSTQRGSFVAWISLAWGVALVAGFLCLWAIDGLHPGLPSAWGVGIFIGLIVVATIFSIVLGARGSRGIKANQTNTFTGTAYGISWSLAMAALGVLGGALIANGLGGTLLLLFYSSAYTLLIGLQYFQAGVIWHAWSSIITGGWLVVVAAVAPFYGYPGNYLVLSIAGGGAFIVLAIVVGVRGRRLQRVATDG